MYLARFSYDVLPANRQRAIDLIRREVQAARRDGRNGRLLVPLTRGQGGAALQFEVELGNLDQLERVRHSGGDPGEDAASLLAPPEVEILRVAKCSHPSARSQPPSKPTRTTSGYWQAGSRRP